MGSLKNDPVPTEQSRRFSRAERPAQAPSLERRDEQELQRGVVVHAHAAVHEDRLLSPADVGDLPRVEVRRRGGGGADDFPQAQVLVHLVELLLGQVDEAPDRAGVGALGDDHQAGAQVGARQRPVAEEFLQEVLERRLLEPRLEQPADRAQPVLPGLERVVPDGAVELQDLADGEAQGEERRDDRARGRAADQVEVVRQDEVALPVAPPQHLLDPREVAERDEAADAAAVEREQALGPRLPEPACERRLNHAALATLTLYFFPLDMAHDVFVSYSSRDKPTADAVVARLEAARLRCWVAPRDILPGMEWGEGIIDGINRSRVMVLVFSSNANASPQIRREVERAVNKGLPIIPFRIEDILPSRSLEYFLSSPHWLDALTPPVEAHIQRLADAVTTLLSRLDGTATQTAPPSPARGRVQKVMDTVLGKPPRVVSPGPVAGLAAAPGIRRRPGARPPQPPTAPVPSPCSSPSEPCWPSRSTSSS